ncbi:MAG TPA: PAS domain S-box protein, partial [Bdellovibrionota bacterium]|nr:PAS domain S-box protein [Bdellovibrionota bacterium]
MALRRKYCGPAPGAGDQALLDAVLDSTADGILVVGLDGRILAFNQRFVELWRIPPDMVRGTEDAELLAFVIGQLTDPDGFLTRVKALYSNSSMESLDILMFKDGRVFERFSQALNVGKAHAGRVWSFRDITRQVLAEEARKASEEFYRAIVESAEEGIWLIDMSGATLFGNRKMSEMLGIDNDRLTGCRVQEFVDREGASILERAIERRKRGMHERYELRLFRPDGSSFWALVSGCPLYDSQRRFIGSFAMVTDITDRKVMEDGLHADVEERANFLQSIVENIPDMIFVKDAGTLRFVQFNQAGEKLLGYSREEMIGKSDFDFFPKEEAEKFVAKDREVLSAGKVADIPEETVHTRHKGSRTLHTKKIPIHDSSGKPAFLLGISEDITLQKRMEEEQRRRLDAEVARKRADLLADLSKRLAATLEPREVVARLARILSTDLAEWSAVAVRDRNGALRVMTAADLGECTLDLGAPEGIPRVLRTGKPVLYQRLGRSSLHRFGFRDPTRLKRLACLEATTGMAVPIFCQSGVRGAILLLARDRPPYEEAELAFAQEVADRAALAFENAWLYQQAQSAIRLRDEFISIASHELRTPLTPLTAQLTLIHRMLEQSGKSVLSDEKLRKLVRLSEHDLGRLTR